VGWVGSLTSGPASLFARSFRFRPSRGKKRRLRLVGWRKATTHGEAKRRRCFFFSAGDRAAWQLINLTQNLTTLGKF
jgi:hypothetical protein